jgi:hypothetical protein
MYIQSLPDGKIMAFKTAMETVDPDMPANVRAQWGHPFNSPMYVDDDR